MDPDRNSRGQLSPFGAIGDAVGSLQFDQFRSHSHDYLDIYYSEVGGSVGVPGNRGSNGSDSDNGGYQISRTTGANGGSETRPVNVNVNYIIKF
jgi:hypothetical protein